MSMELLAPAGGKEALIAAIQNGADAVYLGAQMLNARAGAGNFDRDALKWAADYAHERGARIHVTVNTMVKESEASLLEEVARQMAIHNRQGVRFAKKAGFDRVVLAREMTFREIAECAKERIELEAFAHGALCVSCSGQCLFSSLVGGRSGNRGQCAQPCRLPYRLEGAVKANGSGLIAHSRHSCDFRKRIGVPVAAHENELVLIGEGIEKAIDGFRQLLCRHGILYRAAVRYTFCKFFQCEVVLAVSFFRCIGMILLCCKIARDPADVGSQRVRSVGWDAVPYTEPGIVDAFLDILLIAENIAYDSPDRLAVLCCQFGDCLL